ncbi:MAG: glucose 1-dehydrogenase [Elusimicrobiota bacterium]
MKAVAVFAGAGDIRIIEAPEPEITRPSQVKFQVLEVGICGTDKEIASFAYGTPPDGDDHLIPGHESLVRAVEIGRNVETLMPGDLAVLMVRRPCGEASCRACAAGRQDFCESGGYAERGINKRHGYMAEFVVEEEKYAVKIPPALETTGVLIEPLTIAEKAVVEAARVQERLPYLSGTRAMVLGAGPVALLGAMLLIRRGFAVAVYSLEDPRSENAVLAQNLGADYVCARQTPLSDLARKFGPINLVYEATGSAALAFKALESLGVNGIFIFTGVPGLKGPIPLDADLLMRRMVLQNQLVFGSVNASRRDFEAAAEDLAAFLKAWPQAVPALISARHPMEDFRAPLAGALAGIKHVIRIAATSRL